MESYYDEMYDVHYLFFKKQNGMVEYINETYGVNFDVITSGGRMLSWWWDRSLYIAIYADSPAGVAHEAFHASNVVADVRGFEPSFKNDEPQAYLLDLIFSKYCEKVRPSWNKPVRGR